MDECYNVSKGVNMNKIKAYVVKLNKPLIVQKEHQMKLSAWHYNEAEFVYHFTVEEDLEKTLEKFKEYEPVVCHQGEIDLGNKEYPPACQAYALEEDARVLDLMRKAAENYELDKMDGSRYDGMEMEKIVEAIIETTNKIREQQ